MSARRVCAAMAVAVWALSGGGCSTAPVPAAADPVSRANYPGIEVEPSLAGVIVVGEPKVERGPGGSIERVSTPVRAATENAEINVQYEYRFFDAKDFPLKISTGFKYVKLATRRQEFFEDVPGDGNATSYRLYIRRAR